LKNKNLINQPVKFYIYLKLLGFCVRLIEYQDIYNTRIRVQLKALGIIKVSNHQMTDKTRSENIELMELYKYSNESKKQEILSNILKERRILKEARNNDSFTSDLIKFMKKENDMEYMFLFLESASFPRLVFIGLIDYDYKLAEQFMNHTKGAAYFNNESLKQYVHFRQLKFLNMLYNLGKILNDYSALLLLRELTDVIVHIENMEKTTPLNCQIESLSGISELAEFDIDMIEYLIKCLSNSKENYIICKMLIYKIKYSRNYKHDLLNEIKNTINIRGNLYPYLVKLLCERLLSTFAYSKILKLNLIEHDKEFYNDIMINIMQKITYRRSSKYSYCKVLCFPLESDYELSEIILDEKMKETINYLFEIIALDSKTFSNESLNMFLTIYRILFSAYLLNFKTLCLFVNKKIFEVFPEIAHINYTQNNENYNNGLLEFIANANFNIINYSENPYKKNLIDQRERKIQYIMNTQKIPKIILHIICEYVIYEIKCSY
jgi:hypothetical protein